MRDSLFYRQPEFEIVPMTSEHCRAVAELHAQRFPRAWGDGEFLSLLLQPNSFGFAAWQTNTLFSRRLWLVSYYPARWPVRPRS